MQSTYKNGTATARHVAVIMDGNGRWANSRHLPRVAGHRAGIEAARAVVEAAPGLGVEVLTLYAFSSDNWQRPPSEVRALMHLMRTHLPQEAERCKRHGVRLSIIGRRDRLPRTLGRTIECAEADTADGAVLHLRLAIDYSARDAIVQAARILCAEQTFDREAFKGALGAAYHTDDASPDVDLLIRTGGEQRLSDFLLWECAYAELYFTSCMWPDFRAEDLASAIGAYQARERRFGKVAEGVATRAPMTLPAGSSA